MASQGPLNPSSASTSNSNGGTSDWSNPSNIFAADGSNATASAGLAATSYLLLGTGFGFSLPSDATVNGIQFEVKRNFGGVSAADANIRLLKAGTPAGTDKSAGAAWPGSASYASYGGAADLWGTTWTPSDVNDANFGAAVAASIGATSNANVDHFRITITYTPAVFDAATMPHPQAAVVMRRPYDAVAY